MPREFLLANEPYIEGELKKNSGILFIAQNPGADEVRAGRPLAGNSDRVLRDYLKELDEKQIKYSITNAVKYYTADNRKPSATEIHHCIDDLLTDIKKTNPKLIVALGEVALFALTGLKGIKKLNGKVLTELEGEVLPIPILVCFHPSAIEHGLDIRQFEKGLLPALKYFDKEKPVRFKEVRSLVDAPVMGLLALDIETTGLRPCGVDWKDKARVEHPAKIKCLAIANSKDIYYAEVEDGRG